MTVLPSQQEEAHLNELRRERKREREGRKEIKKKEQRGRERNRERERESTCKWDIKVTCATIIVCTCAGQSLKIVRGAENSGFPLMWS